MRALSNGRPSHRLTITEQAADTLTRWAEGLITGDIPLHVLPGPVAWFYELGLESGRRSRDHEVRTLKHEADRLWLQSFTPAGRREYLLDRLDKVGELIAANPHRSDSFVQDVIESYFGSLDSVREPVRASNPIGRDNFPTHHPNTETTNNQEVA